MAFVFKAFPGQKSGLRRAVPARLPGKHDARDRSGPRTQWSDARHLRRCRRFRRAAAYALKEAASAMFVVTTWWARSFTRLDSDDAAELFYRIGALPQCRSLFPGELDLNDLFQSPLTQLAWNPHEQAVDGLDHLHRCRGAPAGHTLAYKTPGMVLPGCTIFRLGWPHFPSFFLSLANVKRFSGVPRLKFGASPQRRRMRCQIFGIDTSQLI
jgi:hypothetical protein